MASTIYITFIEREASFIKLWGQMDKQLSLFIENTLLQMKPQFDAGAGMLGTEQLAPGSLCCAKFKDGSYYRARVVSLMPSQGIIEVIFIDYGNRDYIEVKNIRSIANFPSSVISLPPQAMDFILAKVQCLTSNLSDPAFEMLCNDIRYLDFEYEFVGQVGHLVLIVIKTNGQEITDSLVAANLVHPLPLHTQQMMLQALLKPAPQPSPMIRQPPSMLPVMQHPKMPSPTVASAASTLPKLLTYKSLPLATGSEHVVYVSYVTDGPCLFAIQLQKKESELQELMIELNGLQPSPLEENPLPGCVCLARSSEDNLICRAVVTNMVDENFKVYFVDFGNSEIQTFQNLYQIPFKYVIPKVMATRFALQGLQGSVVSVDMKVAFKEFVDNKVLKMRVTNTKAGLDLCELWDENGLSALDYVRSASLQAYPEPVALTRGFNQEVKVSYVFGCVKFYVQLRKKENDLSELMNNLQTIQMQPINPQNLQINAPCIALYDGDNMFYRAEIIGLNNDSATVKYVDYGNEEVVKTSDIKAPCVEFITNLRPQAIECCLNGYQNMEPDQERDNLLEEIMLENNFTMKVVDIQSGRILVDLFDEQQYNVASLLLDKLAKSRSQISPALVQEYNRIDQRKSSNSQPQHQRPQPEIRSETWRNKSISPKQSANSWRTENQQNNHEGGGNRDFNRRQQNNTWREQSGNKDNSFEGDTAIHSNEFRRQDRPPRNNFERGGRNDNFERSKNDGFERRNDNFERRNDTFERSKNDSFERRNDNFERSKNDSFERRNDNFERSKNDSFDRPKNDSFDRPKNDSFERRNDGFDRNKNRDGGYRGRSRDKEGNSDNWQKFGDRDRRNKFQDRQNGGADNENDGSEKSWHSNNSKPKGADKTERVRSPRKNIDYADLTTAFDQAVVPMQTEYTVSVSWFYSPVHFYCQFVDNKINFDKMMIDIQYAYKNSSALDSAEVGNSVIALFKADKALYRAIITEVMGSRWKVFFIDFGNSSVTDKIYQVERRFMEFPAQAVQCSLGNITPTEAQWPKASAFSSYFAKDSLNCKFLSIDNSSHIVDLFSDGKSVREGLEAAGLISKRNFDINFLLGQQLFVKVVAVTALDNFSLEISPGVIVSSRIFQQEVSQTRNINALMSFLNQMVIVYVDLVENDSISVTLYDLMGNFVPVIDLQEEMHPTVSAICPGLVAGPQLKGFVAHANETSIFVQNNGTAVDSMLEALFQYYDALEAVEVDVQTVIYAVKSTDGNWYRGQVVDIQESDVTVHYVDYGNDETLPKSELRILHENFFAPYLAIEVLIENPQTYLEQDVDLQISYGEDGWIGVINSNVSSSTSDSTLKAENVEVVTETPVQPTQEIPVEPEIEAPPAEDASQAPPSIGFSVELSHFDHPGQFYLQQSSALDAIDELQDALQSQIEELQEIENISAGIICAAPYSADQVWYRAQVLDADADITTVRFIDYGNTDVLGGDIKIKTLPIELLSLEEHAKRCSLYLSPKGGEWTTEACAKFEQLTEEAALTAEIMYQDEKTTYVRLFANNECINDIFIQENFAEELTVETSTSFSGFVSHLNSPSEFWIQFEHACSDLERVAEQLTNAEKFKPLEDRAPGTLCAAIFPDDESWYRARILSNTVAGLEVLFIDYGNSCTCSSVRELPEDLVMCPPLAHKCSLVKPEGILEWPSSAAETFREISADGVTVFTVIKHGQGETNNVQLLLNDEDISEKLKPSFFTATITNYTSLSQFYIRSCDDNAQFTEIMGKIQTLEEMPEDGETIVAALVGSQWYRAKILGTIVDKHVVELIDVGGEADALEIRQLSEEVANVKPLAQAVKMNPPIGFDWTEESEAKFKTLFEIGNTKLQVEQVNAQIIRIFLDACDIRLQIPMQKSTPCVSVHGSPRKTVCEVTKEQQKGDDASDVIELEITDAITDLKPTANEEIVEELPICEKTTPKDEANSPNTSVDSSKLAEGIENIEIVEDETPSEKEATKSEPPSANTSVDSSEINEDNTSEKENVESNTNEEKMNENQGNVDTHVVTKEVTEEEATENVEKETCNENKNGDASKSGTPSADTSLDSTKVEEINIIESETTEDVLPTSKDVETSQNSTVDDDLLVEGVAKADLKLLKDSEMLTTITDELISKVVQQCNLLENDESSGTDSTGEVTSKTKDIATESGNVTGELEVTPTDKLTKQ